jgi:hypothetical protein
MTPKPRTAHTNRDRRPNMQPEDTTARTHSPELVAAFARGVS